MTETLHQDPVRRFLGDYLRERREVVIDKATDWVVGQALDLRGKRPREETRKLVEGVVRWNEALILKSDGVPLAEFIGFVTAYRAASEFQISTLLRGFCSFRAAMAELLAPPQVEASLAFDSLRVIDDAYLTAIFQMGDEYVAKLNRTILDRRQQLEEDLARVAAQHQREYQEAMAMIHRQQDLLHKVSLPVITVFQGVLVVPLIGELSSERADELIHRLLDAIVANRARVAILDLTGLPEVSEQAALSMVKAARAIRLIGAKVMLVGISASTAATLSQHSFEDALPPSFASLADGLRVALRDQGFTVERTPVKLRSV
ncbi:MAG TPA: STAS domain-containing protein [Pseudomonadota bacterium]|jgi:rsbT co-antagonist protein RsbR|nr:STAS domain-containing protein [Pseudomonadota bacterium]